MDKFPFAGSPKALVAAGVAGALALFSSGSVAGYFYAKKKLIAQYDEKMEAEIERTRKHFAKLNKFDEFSTPEAAAQHIKNELANANVELTSPNADKVVEEAAEAMTRYGSKIINDGHGGFVLDKQSKDVTPEDKVFELTYPSGEVTLVDRPIGGPPVIVPPVRVDRNVFTEPQPEPGVDFRYEDEVAARSSDKPYIISLQEFSESDFHQIQLTWYEGDQTLADDQQGIVHYSEYGKKIGSLDNLRFGHRSDDNNIVYIRNEYEETDYEIARSEGKYSVEVAGFTEEDQPYTQPMRRRTYRGVDG